MIRKMLLCLSLLFVQWSLIGQHIQPYDIGAINEPSYNLYNEKKAFSMPYITNCESSDCTEAIDKAWAYVIRGALESRYLVKYEKDTTETSRFSVDDFLDNLTIFNNSENIQPFGKRFYAENNPMHAINYLTKNNNSCVALGEFDKNLYPRGIINDLGDYCLNREPVAYVTQIHHYISDLGGDWSNSIARVIKSKGAVIMNIPWIQSQYDKTTTTYTCNVNLQTNLHFYLPVLVIGWDQGAQALKAVSPFVDGEFTLFTPNLAYDFHIFSVDIDTNANALLHYDNFGPDYIKSSTIKGALSEGFDYKVPAAQDLSDTDYDILVKYETPDGESYRLNKVSLFAYEASDIKVEIYDGSDVDLTSKLITGSPIAVGEYKVSDSVFEYYNSNLLGIKNTRNTSYYTVNLKDTVLVKGDFYVKTTITSMATDPDFDGAQITISAGVGADPVADKNKAWYGTSSDPFANDFADVVTNKLGTGAKPTIRVHLDEPWLVEYSFGDNEILFLDSAPNITDSIVIENGKIDLIDTLKLAILDPSGKFPHVGEYDLRTSIVRENVSNFDTTNLYRTKTPDKKFRINKRGVDVKLLMSPIQQICNIDTSEVFRITQIQHKNSTRADSLRINKIVTDSIYNNLWVKKENGDTVKFATFKADSSNIIIGANYKVYLNRKTLNANFDITLSRDTGSVEFERIETDAFWTPSRDTILVGSTIKQGIRLDATYDDDLGAITSKLLYDFSNNPKFELSTSGDSIYYKTGKPAVKDILNVNLDLDTICYTIDTTFKFVFLPKPEPVADWPASGFKVGDSISLENALQCQGIVINLPDSVCKFKTDNSAYAEICSVTGKLVIKDTSSFKLIVGVKESDEYDILYDTITYRGTLRMVQNINWSLEQDTVIYVGKKGLSIDSANILYATATSGLGVTYAGTTLQNGKFVLKKPTADSIITITGSQLGDGIYTPATDSVKRLIIRPKSYPIVTVNNLYKYIGDTISLDTVVAVTPILNPVLDTAIFISDPTKGYMSGSKLIITDTGKFDLIISVPESDKYDTISTKGLVTVGRKAQYIDWSLQDTIIYVGKSGVQLNETAILNAITSSNLNVTYAGINFTSGKLMLTKPTSDSIITITASQEGSKLYVPAIDSVRRLTIRPKTNPIITVTDQYKYVGDTINLGSIVTVTPLLDTTLVVSDPTKGYISGGKLIITDTGNFELIVNVAETAMHDTMSNKGNIYIGRKAQHINWSLKDTIIYVGKSGVQLNETAILNAITSSSLNVTYAGINFTSGKLMLTKPTSDSIITITASQEGSKLYVPAIDSVRRLTIRPKVNPIITVTDQHKYVGDTINLGSIVTVTPLLDTTLVVSDPTKGYISGGKLIITDTGSFELIVNVAETAMYDAANNKGNIHIGRKAQHIVWSFESDTIMYVGKKGAQLTETDILTATASSKLNVTYTGITFTSGKLMLTKPTADSTITITASQVGNKLYSPAIDSIKRIIIRPKGTPVIVINPVLNQKPSDVVDLSTVISVSPNLPYTIEVSDNTKAEIDSNGDLVIKDYGNFNLIVKVAETEKFDDAEKLKDIVVNHGAKLDQHIDWGLLNDTIIYVGKKGLSIDSAQILYATASSTLKVGYTGITLTNGKLVLTKPTTEYTITVIASQQGDNDYNAAIDVTKGLKIVPKQTPTIVITPIENKKPNDVVDLTGLITVTPNLPYTVEVSDNTKAIIDSNGDLVILQLGDFDLIVKVAETEKYEDAQGSETVVPIAPGSKLNQHINWTLQNDTVIYVGKKGLSLDSAQMLYATASSALKVNYTGITLANGKLVLAKPSTEYTMFVTASQQGDNDYNAALDVVKGLKIRPKGDPNIGINPIEDKNPGDVINLDTIVNVNPDLPFVVEVSDDTKAYIDGNGNLVIIDTGDFELIIKVPETDEYDFAEESETVEVNGNPATCTEFVVKWGHVLTCDNTGLVYKSYQWYRNNQIIPGATKQYYKAAKDDVNADFFVEATRHNGTVDIYCGKIKEDEIPVKSNTVLLYPNPAQAGSVAVLSSGVDPSDLEKSILRIYTNNGQLVNSFKPNTESPDIKITMPSVSGVYIIKLSTPEDEITLRTIVK